jgi:hypothetical protein
LSGVVLPLPKKPLIIMTGIGSMMLEAGFIRFSILMADKAFIIALFKNKAVFLSDAVWPHERGRLNVTKIKFSDYVLPIPTH